jgi:hypothetical protein
MKSLNIHKTCSNKNIWSFHLNSVSPFKVYPKHILPLKLIRDIFPGILHRAFSSWYKVLCQGKVKFQTIEIERFQGNWKFWNFNRKRSLKKITTRQGEKTYWINSQVAEESIKIQFKIHIFSIELNFFSLHSVGLKS